VKNRLQQGLMHLKCNNGYTLIELMVVVVIIGILATGVVFMFANPSARVKNQAFTMLGELNMARSEAVSENEDVLVVFINDKSGECDEGNIAKCADAGGFDGYMICFDDDTSGGCDAADTIIEVTMFDQRIQYYDTNATDGPDKWPDNATNLLMTDGPDVDFDNDGVTFKGTNNNYFDGFYYTPMGTAVVDTAVNPDEALDSPAYVYIYYPVSATEHDEMQAPPYAVVLNQSTGTARISRWIIGSSWKTK
jgi:prepilin-type N-terminal cleavage/methylation domain-containing protein